MTRSQKIVGFLVVTLAGAWGCAKVPTGNAGSGKNPSLEAKAQRLEEDFRAAAAARDQFRQKLLAAEEKLAAAETQTTQWQAQFEESRTALTSATTERDNLRTELKSRTTERDNLAVQFDSFRKNIRNLLGQAENALASPNTPPVAVGAQIVPAAEGSALRN